MNGHRVLVANLQHGSPQGDSLRAISGSMVAYEGDVAFKNAGMGGGGGLRAALKQKVTGESLSLMEVSGKGTVYFAVDAQDITIVEIANDSMHVRLPSSLPSPAN